MPRKPTGTIYESNGRIYAQVTVGHNKRRSFVLPDAIDCDAAEKQATVLAEFATKLRNAGREDIVDELLDIASQRTGRELDDVRRAVDLIAAGKVVPKRNTNTPTIRELGKRWTSGELSRLYPDHSVPRRHGEEAIMAA